MKAGGGGIAVILFIPFEDAGPSICNFVDDEKWEVILEF